jgi:hypothetical protein
VSLLYWMRQCNSLKLLSRTVIGAAVGGAVGGVAVIAVVIHLLRSSRGKTRARDVVEIDPDPKSTVYDDGAAPFTIVPTLSPLTMTPAESRTMTPTNFTPPSLLPGKTVPTLFPSATTPAESPTMTPPSLTLPPTLPGKTAPTLLPSSVTPAEPHTMTPASLSPTCPNTAIGNSELSQEQAQFVHSLYVFDVPAPAIASVINTMVRMRDEHGDGPGSIVPGRMSPDEEPPNYDFKAP